MKKYFFIAVFVVFCLTNLTLFAEENAFFSVKQNKWDYKKIDDNNYFYVLKEYEPAIPDRSFKPTINISVKPSDRGYQYYKADSEIRKDTTKLLEDAFKKDKEIFEKNMKANFKTIKHQISEKKQQEIIDSYLDESKIIGVSIKEVGGHKAVFSEYQIAFINIKIITILTLTNTYAIMFKSSVEDDFDSSAAYKEFVSNFKPKGMKASFFTATLFANWYWIALFIVGIISGIYGFIKKSNSF